MATIKSKWLSVLGSFLVVMGKSRAEKWRGSHAGDGPDHCALATEASNWISTIRVNGESILVFAGDITPVSWAENDGTPIIVRWIFAESEDDVARHIVDLSTVEFGPPRVVWEINEDKVLLFESVLSGQEALDNTLALSDISSLTYDLRCGIYHISTAHFQPDEATSLVLHKFDRE